MTPHQEVKGQIERRRRDSTVTLDSLLNPAQGRTPKLWIWRQRGNYIGNTRYDVFAIVEDRPTWLSRHIHNVCGFRFDLRRETLSSGYEDLGRALENVLGFKVFTETF